MSEHRHTRRELVRGVFGRGRPTQGDIGRLTRLLELERLADDVYGLALRSPDLSVPAHQLAGELRAQEREHAAALIAEIGSAPPRPPHATTQIEAALAKLGITVRLDGLHGERAWFNLLENLENSLEGAYYEALRHLVAPAVAMLAARILASEGQHSTALFLLRHPGDITLAVFEGLVKGTAAGQ